MIFPFESLAGSQRELGLVVAVLIGFGFGFVLERAGFGRANKLVAQFYGNDMAVLKVMFGAVVTAMIGMVVLDGFGLVDMRAVANTATSATFIWPAIAGGFLVGAGFVISGYCPGTSVVAAMSGKIDGIAVVIGVVIGTLVWGELSSVKALAEFADSGYLGQIYLYDVLGIPAAVIALFVAAVAIGAFLGAEKLERIIAKDEAPASPAAPKRLVFAGLGAFALVGAATLALPSAPGAKPSAPAAISAGDLARRVLDEPWKVRVLDVRPMEACAQARVPGAECTPPETLKDLYLADVSAARDLVVVGEGALAELPAEIRAYRGKIFALEDGFAGWKAWALTPPAQPSAGASAEARAEYGLRAGIHSALTGTKAPPPPPAPAAGAAPVKRKAGGGGCSG